MSNFKTWANNEILTAADLNLLLMQQVIVTVEDATERDALPSAVRAVYREDLDVIQFRYNLTWRTVELTPTRTTYAPTTSNITKGTGSTETGFSTVRDGWCDFFWALTFGTGGSIGNNPSLNTLPATPDTTWDDRDILIGSGVFRDASQTGTTVTARVPLEAVYRAENGQVILGKVYTGASGVATDYAALSYTSTGFPTIASGDTLTIRGRYPVAL